jgi:dephospho-CoA kinase
MSIVLGITGTIGSGKSAVGKILETLGVPVIDTDEIVHELLTCSGNVRTAAIERFGQGILRDDGSGEIDRNKLGAIVFSDQQARRDLESIVHPAVLEQYRLRARRQSDQPVVAVLVPLLFEAGIESEFDQIWTVIASEQVLRERLARRDNLSNNDIERRLMAQLPQATKAERAHQTIDNSKSLDETKRQVELLLNGLITDKQ